MRLEGNKTFHWRLPFYIALLVFVFEEMFPGLPTETNTLQTEAMRLVSKSSLLQEQMEVFIQLNGEQTFAWVWRHIGYRRLGHIYMAVFPGLTASCVTMATIRCHFNTPPTRVNTQLGIKGSLPDCFGWSFTDKRFVSVLFEVRSPLYVRLNLWALQHFLFKSTTRFLGHQNGETDISL